MASSVTYLVVGSRAGEGKFEVHAPEKRVKEIVIDGRAKRMEDSEKLFWRGLVTLQL